MNFMLDILKFKFNLCRTVLPDSLQPIIGYFQARGAGRNELVRPDGLENVVSEYLLAVSSESPVIPVRSYREKSFLSGAKTQARVCRFSGGHCEMPRPSPASRANAVTNVSPVQINPILAPILVVISAEHKNDRLSARVSGQFEPFAEPAKCVVANRVLRVRNSCRTSQQQIFNGTPALVRKFRFMVAVRQPLLVFGWDSDAFRAKSKPPPRNFHSMLRRSKKSVSSLDEENLKLWPESLLSKPELKRCPSCHSKCHAKSSFERVARPLRGRSGAESGRSRT
jgi:hypothetical protein